MITFTISGEGTLIANPTIKANPVRAEAGIATALVRTTQAVGSIEVRASAPGLKEASAQFTSTPSQAVSWPRMRERKNLQ